MPQEKSSVGDPRLFRNKLFVYFWHGSVLSPRKYVSPVIIAPTTTIRAQNNPSESAVMLVIADRAAPPRHYLQVDVQ